MTPTPKSATTVTVGCKLPHGLLCELGVKGADDYRSVTLRGAQSARIFGGYGITENVPADFMAEWMKRHARLTFVRKGLVFVHGDTLNAEAHAKDNAGIKSGFERLDPTKLPGKLEADPESLKAVGHKVAA